MGGCAAAFFSAGIVAIRVAEVRNVYKLSWLPLLTTLWGAGVGFMQGTLTACLIAAMYSAVPYTIGIDVAAGLGIGQAIIICYFHLGRADFIHK